MPAKSHRDRYSGVDVRERPAYSTVEAAHHVRIPENTVRAWCFGRTFRLKDGSHSQVPPLVTPADPARRILSFFNLLELHAIRGLRRNHDLQMRGIRVAVETLHALFPSPHPLLDRRMQTDGLRLFTEHRGGLVDLTHRGQMALREVFEAHLKRIEYDEQGVATRFFPFSRPIGHRDVHEDAQPRTVVINPRVAFGRPVLIGTRIPTVEIFERFVAGDSIAMISADYDHPAEAIEEALRWEQAA